MEISLPHLKKALILAQSNLQKRGFLQARPTKAQIDIFKLRDGRKEIAEFIVGGGTTAICGKVSAEEHPRVLLVRSPFDWNGKNSLERAVSKLLGVSEITTSFPWAPAVDQSVLTQIERICSFNIIITNSKEPHTSLSSFCVQSKYDGS
jgi:hypothetical protein